MKYLIILKCLPEILQCLWILLFAIFYLESSKYYLHFVKLSKVVLSDREKFALYVANLGAAAVRTFQGDVRCIIESIFCLDQKLLG